MNRTSSSLCILFAALALAATSFVAAGDDVIEDFTLQPVGEGEPFTLSEAQGKYVALHFLLKTECPVCLRHTHQHHRGAAGRDDLVQVFIKPDEEADTLMWMEKFPQDAEYEGPKVHRDPNAELAEKLGIPDGYEFHGETVHYPALVLIGPDGTEALRYVGENNRDRYTWEQLAKFLEGNADAAPESQPTSQPTSEPAPKAESRPTSKPSS